MKQRKVTDTLCSKHKRASESRIDPLALASWPLQVDNSPAMFSSHLPASARELFRNALSSLLHPSFWPCMELTMGMRRQYSMEMQGLRLQKGLGEDSQPVNEHTRVRAHTHTTQNN